MKGFAGGFGRRALGPWGEEIIKLFVREAVDEALKLETVAQQAAHRAEGGPAALLADRRDGGRRAEGDLPYLGSSRLEEPLIRYPVDVVFHGHAHHGALEGKTVGGVPVYNVSLSLLTRSFPDRPPFRVVELETGADGRKGGQGDRRDGGQVERRVDGQSDRRAESPAGRRPVESARESS